MFEKFKYLSPEWRDEAERTLRRELSPEKMNHATSSMSDIFHNCPDGKERFLFFDFVDGNLTILLCGEGNAPDAEFKISGDYETFAKISQAEMGAQAALMSGKLKLKGSMVKALKLASVCDRLNKVLSIIPTEY
jgi:putative sterol carrier protein